MPRLRDYNPAAKLVLGLRHPAYRAFSHWRMEKARNLESMSFEQAISARGHTRVQQSPGGVHRVFSYIERGFYAAQIERMLQLFPREQIHFFRTDQLWEDPGGTLGEIERFLAVEAYLGARIQRRYVAPIDSANIGTFGMPERATLTETFRADIRRAEELAQLDLSDWLFDDYQEPMRKGAD